MFGRKARRITELEVRARRAEADALLMAERLVNVTDQTRSMRTRIVNQRNAIHELNRALSDDRDRQALHEAINRARLLVSGWVKAEPGRHDGNHPVGECEACDVFRALAPFGQDWHRVMRAYGATVNRGAG